MEVMFVLVPTSYKWEQRVWFYQSAWSKQIVIKITRILVGTN